MTDTTFITNQNGETLLDRFKSIIVDTKYFDCIVGYFYASGFLELSESLKNTEKIRILIGLSTDKETFDIIQETKRTSEDDIKSYSKSEIHSAYSRLVKREMEDVEEKIQVEQGVQRFMELISTEKLKIKVYREKDIHAKVYIMKFEDGDRDYGRVITGSSNFSHSGLQENIEFNVELKDRSDYEFAHERFEELWNDAEDVTADYVKTIQKETWLSTEITPYELYLKFLYEALKEQINQDLDGTEYELPEGYKELRYQKDAVTDAISKLNKYNGVFISDVVGLGKTYITALLLKKLNERAIILAPPTLVDTKNPGSWNRVLEDFGVLGCYCESIGKIDTIQDNTDIKNFKYIVIDEAHRFRNERTQMYDDLYRLCIGKKIILVTATPLNNSPKDILSQIKLFQPAHQSTLPNPETKDLEKYFGELERNLSGLDRQKDKDKYLKIVRDNSEKIRKDILQHLMVRRTRSSIVKYYTDDIKKQGLKFPDVADPTPLYYQFDNETDKLFNKSIELITKKFRYSRYAPLLYLKNKQEQMISGQKNMKGFMRILLLKRLESSFYAFRMTVERMIESYQRFIQEFEIKGHVYTGDNSVKNLMKLLEEENFEKISKMIDEGRVQEHKATEFEDNFIDDLKSDLAILTFLSSEWKKITSDPKLQKFLDVMKNDKNLYNQKVLIFTESKETADYITDNLKKSFGDIVLSINGSSSSDVKQAVIDNFDGKVSINNQKDFYRILVTTEVLAEGMNLHRSNVVVNYDIPWNPVRMIQRVGRINRVGTKFNTIYTYNFFPTGPINEEIKLQEAAEAKIEAFIEMLGNDAKLLTDEEIKSHDLFNKLTNKKTITGEDEEDDLNLHYLKVIREIRDLNTELFNRIKNLPVKARVARKSEQKGLITFFRKGDVQRIFISDGKLRRELDFLTAASILNAPENEKGFPLPREQYEYLKENREAFDEIFKREFAGCANRGTKDRRVSGYLQAMDKSKFTNEEMIYVNNVISAINRGTVSKYTISKIDKEMLLASNNGGEVSYSFLNILRNNIDSSMIFWGEHTFNDNKKKTEVILSEYLGV